MIARLQREEGNVIVIAIASLTLMLMIGLTALATVDTQTDVSKKERERESTFNLTEAVLNAQTFILGRLGTGNLGKPFPVQCPTTPATDLCPDQQKITNSYDQPTQPDFDPTKTSWTTVVRDNSTGLFYDPTLEAPCNASPTSTECRDSRYDLNGDRQMWVKSTAVVRGKTRSIVALIKVEDRSIVFPQYGLNAGFFFTTNSGNKTIVDASGSLGVGVRCTEPPPSTSCLGYSTTKGQLVGGYTLGYSNATAISADDLQGLEDYAKASGTYYDSCPSNPNGLVVYVKSGNCEYNDSTPGAPGETRCCNTSDKPGLLIVANGTLSLLGNITFHGLIYMPNQQNSSGPVVTTGGTVLIDGGVSIDGPGGLAAGSSGLNIDFNSRAFEQVHTIGTAGVVQNTWREIIG